VEAQLERLGLWDRVERRPKDRADASQPAESTSADADPPFPSGTNRD
jgi:hypothetical protein